MLAQVAALVGCSASPAAPPAPTLSVPFPRRAAIEAHAGDYRAFVAAWTGALPARVFDAQAPMTPSDARRVPVIDGGKTMERQQQVLVKTFEEWCEASGGTAWPRSDDMSAPGHTMAVCETKASAQKVAALRVTRDPEAAQGGRHGLYVEHWYPPDIVRYQRELHEQRAQQAAAHRAAMAQVQAEEKARRQERKAREAADLDRMVATAARTRPTLACQGFERASNALLARFGVALNRADLRRYTADLAVALVECASARTRPPEALLAAYRFHLQSFQLLGDAWDRRLLPACSPEVICHLQDREASVESQREMGELQSRYPDLRWLSAPERAADITGRLQPFVVDR